MNGVIQMQGPALVGKGPRDNQNLAVALGGKVVFLGEPLMPPVVKKQKFISETENCVVGKIVLMILRPTIIVEMFLVGPVKNALMGRVIPSMVVMRIRVQTFLVARVKLV